jgi:hypothetical protein
MDWAIDLTRITPTSSRPQMTAWWAQMDLNHRPHPYQEDDGGIYGENPRCRLTNVFSQVRASFEPSIVARRAPLGHAKLRLNLFGFLKEGAADRTVRERGAPVIMRTDAARLPLSEASIDCVVTSAPYDVGMAYAGVSDAMARLSDGREGEYEPHHASDSSKHRSHDRCSLWTARIC